MMPSHHRAKSTSVLLQPPASTFPTSTPIQRAPYDPISEADAQKLRKQHIPNPLPSLCVRRQNPPANSYPMPLPDYEYCHDDDNDDDDEENGVTIADDLNHEDKSPTEDSQSKENSKAERARRIQTHALRHLAGEPLYILSAQLKGPFEQNPWKPKISGDEGRESVNKRKAAENISQSRLAGDLTKKRKIGTNQKSNETFAGRSARSEPVMKSKSATKLSTKPSSGRGKSINTTEIPTVVLKDVTPSHTLETWTEDQPCFDNDSLQESSYEPTAKKRKLTNKRKLSAQGPKRPRKPSAKSVNKLSTDQAVKSTSRSKNSETSTRIDEEPCGTIVVSSALRQAQGRPSLPTNSASLQMNRHIFVHEASLPTAFSHEKRNTLSSRTYSRGLSLSSSPLSSPPPSSLPQTTPKHNNPSKPSSRVTSVSDTPPAAMQVSAQPPATLPSGQKGPIPLYHPTPPSVFYGNSKSSKKTSTPKLVRLKPREQKKISTKATRVPRNSLSGTTDNADKANATASGSKQDVRGASVPTIGFVSVAKKREDGTPYETNPQEEGDSAGGINSGIRHGNNWTLTPNGFQYKRSNIQSETAWKQSLFTESRDGIILADVGNEQPETTVTRQLRTKKVRNVDLAALSPFGGGQVITRSATDSQVTKLNQSEPDKAKQAVPLEAASFSGDIEQAPYNDSSTSGSSFSSPLEGRVQDEICEHSENTGGLSEYRPSLSAERALSDPTQLASSEFSQKSRIVVAQPRPINSVHGSHSCHPGFNHLYESESSSRDQHSGPKNHDDESLVNHEVAVAPSDPSFQHGTSTSSPVQHSPWQNTQLQFSAARRGFKSALETQQEAEYSPLVPKSHTLESGSLSREFYAAAESLVDQSTTFDLEKYASLQESSFILKKPSSANTTLGMVSTPGSANLFVPPNMSVHGALPNFLNPTPLSALRTSEGGNITLSSPLITYDDRGGHTATLNTASKHPDFASFQAFKTPTKSQFGNFESCFSPLTKSSPPLIHSEQRSYNDRPLIRKSESEDGDESFFDALDGVAQLKPRKDSDTSGKLSSDVSGALESDDILHFGPVIQNSVRIGPGKRNPDHRDVGSLSVTPGTMQSASLPILPSTPRRDHGRLFSSQQRQALDDSPGRKMAGEMLDLMDNGIWDLDEELEKIGGSSAAKSGTQRPRVSGVFSSGSRWGRSGRK